MRQPDGKRSTRHLCRDCRRELARIVSGNNFIDKIRALRESMTHVCENQALSWDAKHMLIFDTWFEPTNSWVNEFSGTEIEYRLANTGYEDDVRAFYDAFMDKFGAV